MIKLIIFNLFIIISVCIHSQSSINFSYDAAGNRINRSIVVTRASEQSKLQELPLKNDFEETRVTIYPNPTKGIISISIQGGNEEFKNSSLALYSISGALITSNRISDRTVTIDIRGENKGMYILKLILDGQISEWKVIKE
ncbi:MAG: T9SS type A sorting domain-containing protein, partial [Bacteroidales bacterium]